MKVLILFILAKLALADDYYYDDDYEDNVLAAASEAPSPGEFFNQLQEKLYDGSATTDPVYNFIMGFSALALFFQAFYTPFGKTSIGKRFGLEEAFKSSHHVLHFLSKYGYGLFVDKFCAKYCILMKVRQ